MDVPKAKTKPLKGKKSASAVGAPSQHNQSSRKGKRAWRKNVNIEDVEEVLEGMRVEERVTGAALSKTADEDLFQIDLKGDDKIRHTLPRFSTSQLTSSKILAQRSAVPAVVSRVTSSSKKRKSTVSREDKEKLLRITKRPRKGPFNAIMDPSEYAPGSGIVELSEAVKQSGTYDPWQEGSSAEGVKDGLETVEKRKPKAPTTTKTRDLIEVPAIVEPHLGTSYNPPADAHEELIMRAASMEEKRVKEAEKLAEVKKKIDAAKNTQEDDDFIAPGMKVQELGLDEEQISDGLSRSNTTSKPRKTQAKKNKAVRLLAEKRALAERAQRKRLLASINDARSIRKANSRLLSAREKEREQRQLALVEKLKTQGLAGQKLGKYKVPEGEIDVQLGEDLSENLRGLKPEGNLFRDRFQSLQQRALIEPRVRILPKKRTHRIVEYEKHAWKKFDRE
ncbi:unnamed protein product [Cyclocybe aegerita]|uniref:Ribosome biogenesis protein NOP53 n=1 Tax=Cyclocybe aegerita TaxID=1973307 RepID=A0A8S0WAQ5_CYCAE|nr:unnamed protein product [Cyclocybe aegerita]